MQDDQKQKTAGGRCLCGKVRFEVQGPLRDVVNCHCSKCRKFHGNFGAYTRARAEQVKIDGERYLKWYASTTDETADVQRGFCRECGSALFWHPKGQPHISIAAGALDEPTRLKTIGHIWCVQKPDFYEIADDLPRFEERWE